jgi:hypothetical protein
VIGSAGHVIFTTPTPANSNIRILAGKNTPKKAENKNKGSLNL